MTMGQNKDIIDAYSSTKHLALLDAFLAVVAAGSFTMAARRTHADKSLLSRRVRALEEALGVRLLHRTTRKIHVTEAGQALYEAVADPIDRVARALAEVAEGDRVQGRVRLTTIPYLARPVVVPVLEVLGREHPDVHLEIRASEDLVNLVERGVDVALRTGNLPDSNLVSRRLAQWSYVLCASPAWVERHRPQRPEDLVPHWILYDEIPHADRWEFGRGEERLNLRMGSVLSTDNGLVIHDAVRGGLGVSAFTPFMVDEDLASGRLVRVLPQWEVRGRYGVFVVYPHRGLLPRRVEVVIDQLSRQLRLLQPHWDALSRPSPPP